MNHISSRAAERRSNHLSLLMFGHVSRSQVLEPGRGSRVLQR